MSKNKVISINKRLETIFKDTKSLKSKDIKKVLFNIEILKHKYLKREDFKDYKLFEQIHLKDILLIIESKSLPGV